MTKVLGAALAIALAMGTADACGATAEMRAVRVDDGVYVVAANNPDADTPRRGNAGFVVGPRGVVIVDSGISRDEGAAILAAVRQVTTRPIRLAILTQPEQEAIFGAAAFQAEGIPVLMHRDAATLMASRCDTCLRNLHSALGESAMAGTRVIVPDRRIDGDEDIDLIGRRMRLIAPPRSSAPGAIAVLDMATATLFAGNIVSIRNIPDTRDADPEGWRKALATLAETHCRHLVPTHGAVASCSDVGTFASYFSDLEHHVLTLLGEGTTLAELGERSALPKYARWARYEELHRANASRVYLRLERAQFGLP